MKIRGKLLCYLSIFLLCITSIWNEGAIVCLAEEESEGVMEKWYVYASDEIPDVTLSQGETQDVTLELKASYVKRVDKITVDVKDTPFTVKGTPKLYKKGIEDEVHSIGSDTYYLKFKLLAKKSTENKTYNISIKFLAGSGLSDMETYTLMDTLPVTYQAEKEESGKGNLVISDITCSDNLKTGESTNVVYSLGNMGDGKATDITITYEGFDDTGLLPEDNETSKKLSVMEANAEKKFTFPIKVAKNAVTGAKKLTITVSYKTKKDAETKATETESFYVQVQGKAATDKTTKVKAPKLLISNVKQSVAKPAAGKEVVLSFDIKNIGLKAAKNVTVTPTGLSNMTFTPLDNNPSVYIKALNINEKKVIKLRYRLSSQIGGGLNSIDYAIAFKDANGTDYTDTVKLYIKNVKAKKESASKGVPKLIIEKYSTGTGSVRAGGEFTFGFDIANTHTSLSADNIKVTITSDDAGTFSVAKGSNSFYISSIGAKKSIHKEIPIKVKADCTTKSYPLKLDFEYEFKGMEKPKNTLTSGLTVSETLNIQVEEDSRPALTNILPGAYGELVNGETNSVTFDFNNHGKSPLYNVEVCIKGDFDPTQESYFIGTVEAGAGASHEMEITPTVDGTATGIMIVTYEDSNGKKGKIKQEFTGEVMPGGDMGDIGMDPAMDGEVPTEDTGKKAIVSVPVFAVIEIVVFLLGMFVVRKIGIARYRKKKMLEEEKEL